MNCMHLSFTLIRQSWKSVHFYFVRRICSSSFQFLFHRIRNEVRRKGRFQVLAHYLLLGFSISLSKSLRQNTESVKHGRIFKSASRFSLTNPPKVSPSNKKPIVFGASQIFYHFKKKLVLLFLHIAVCAPWFFLRCYRVFFPDSLESALGHSPIIIFNDDCFVSVCHFFLWLCFVCFAFA